MTHRSIHHCPNPMLNANYMALCFIKPKLLLTEVLIAGIEVTFFYFFGAYDLKHDPTIFVYELDPGDIL